MVPRKETAFRIFENAARGDHFEDLFIGRHSHAFSSHLEKSEADLINRNLSEGVPASTFDNYYDMLDTIEYGIEKYFDEFYREYSKAYAERESGGAGKFSLTMYGDGDDPYHGFEQNVRAFPVHS